MELLPFNYHVKLRNHFREQKKTWDWFSSVKVKEEQLQEFKTSLLKNTYRLDRESNPELYLKIDLAKEKLGLTLDVTVYQLQNSTGDNAGISYVPGEAHIALSGSILKLLNDEELLSVLAHELAHVKFYMIENSEFEVAQRIITSIANDFRSDDTYIETARLFQLYMELFCDRGSLLVTGNSDAVLSSLIKINTGLEKVSVESYLKQTEEIFASETVKAEHQTHPETYIRVKALSLWDKDKEKSADEIIKMIEGKTQMNNLDLFKQEQIRNLTHDILKLILKPKWYRTTAVMSLAKQYKSNFKTDDAFVITPELQQRLAEATKSVKEYLAYVFLDFALVDPTLEDVPMGFSFQVAEDISLKDSFNDVVKKELKLGERKLHELHVRATKALSEMKESTSEHIYED